MILDSCKTSCVFGSHVINYVSYADDLIIFCTSAKHMTYDDDHDINLALTKTIAMLMYDSI